MPRCTFIGHRRMSIAERTETPRRPQRAMRYVEDGTHRRRRHRLHRRAFHRRAGRAQGSHRRRGVELRAVAPRSSRSTASRCSISTPSATLPLYVDGADECDPQQAPDQGRRRGADAREDHRRGHREVRLHHRRGQARRRARQVPAADRGDPDGAQLCRARNRQARRPAGLARRRGHRQRQLDPRRARLAITDPVALEARSQPDHRRRHASACSRSARPTSC